MKIALALAAACLGVMGAVLIDPALIVAAVIVAGLAVMVRRKVCSGLRAAQGQLDEDRASA
jgi:hypothetical protein